MCPTCDDADGWLADKHRRRRALDDLMEQWLAESGPPDPEGVAAMTERFFNRQ